MHLEKLNKYIKAAILTSLAYTAATFFLEDQIASSLKNQMPLLGVTALLIIINIGMLLVYLFRGGAIGVSIILLNLAQLALFFRLFIQIHTVLGPENYSYPSPLLYDWAKFVALHTLKAVDLLDATGAYGIETRFFQKSGFLSHQSTLTGIALLGMQIMPALFVGGAIFKAVSRASTPDQETKFRGIVKWILRGGLIAAISGIAVLGWKNSWGLNNWLLWPLNNILLTLDIGDALQIFGRHLQPPEMGVDSASVAVFFRLIIACYAFVLLNRLYLRISSTRQSVEELAMICLSSEYSSEERLSAIKKLEELGTFADAAIPQLVKTLADGNNDIRNAATESLKEIDPQWPESESARSVIPDLVKLLLTKDKEARNAAAQALETVDPQWPESEAAHSVIPNLVNALFEKDKGAQIAAAEALGKIGPAAAKAVPHLIKGLSDKDRDFRCALTQTLGNMGPDAEEAIPDIIKVLADDNAHNKAVKALEKIGPAATPHLVEALADSDDNIRNGSAEALDEIDSQWKESEFAREAVKYFVKVLGDSFSSFRSAAADALGIIGPAEVIPNLVNVLADGEEDVRRAAGEALEKIDPRWQESESARKAIPRFVKALVDNDSQVRRAAAQALGKIDSKWQKSEIARKAIPHFVRALKYTLPTVRSSAASALGEIGPGAIKAIPYLIKVLADKENDVRRATAVALEKIEPRWRKSKSTAQAIRQLLKELENEDWEVRNATAAALGDIGTSSVRTISKLAKLLIDSDKRVRGTAIESLEKIESEWRKSEGTRKAISYFVKALGDSKWIVRVSAVEALAEIGPTSAKTAAPYLARALKDSVIDVQNAAGEALEKIDPTGKLREQEVAEGGYITSATDKALGEMDPEAAEAIPHLIKKLIDSDRSVRIAARKELAKIDPKWPQTKNARSMIPYLVKEGLPDSRWIVRSSAAEALGDFGPAAAKVVPRLIKAMSTDSTVDVRGAAKKALEKIDPTGKLRK